MTPLIDDGPKEHDISTNFQLINNFGAVIYIIGFLLLSCVAVTKNDCAECAGAVFIPLLITLWAPHFLAMNIFRFRHAGKVCSGDFLEGRWDL